MAAMVVPPLAIAFWRNGLATVGPRPGGGAPARRARQPARAGRCGWWLLSGLMLAVHFGTWVTSLTLTSVASATAIVCLQIAWVVAWQLTRGERFGTGVLAGLALAFAGVLVVSGVDLTLSTRALVGDLLALVGGVAAAAYMVIGSRARQTSRPRRTPSSATAPAPPCCWWPAWWPGRRWAATPPAQWGLLLLVTATAQLMGHSVFNHLLATTSPMLVSLALLLEVPGAALLAAAAPRPGAAAGRAGRAGW